MGLSPVSPREAIPLSTFTGRGLAHFFDPFKGEKWVPPWLPRGTIPCKRLRSFFAERRVQDVLLAATRTNDRALAATGPPRAPR